MNTFFQPLHRKVIAGIAAVFVLLLMMASCGPRQPAYYPQPAMVPQMQTPMATAPVVVAPQVHHDSGGGFGSALAGSFLGSMAGNMLSNRNSGTTVVERHVTSPPITTTSPTQRYAPPPSVAHYSTPYRSPTPQVQTYSSNRGVQTTVTSHPSTFGSSTRTTISSGVRLK